MRPNVFWFTVAMINFVVIGILIAGLVWR